jgi:two-component system, NarL family, sensor histidine kinase DesK
MQSNGAGDPPTQQERWAELAAGDDLGQDVSAWMRRRRAITGTLLTVFLLAPTVTLVAGHGFTGKALFLLPATLIFAAAVAQVFVKSENSWEFLRRSPLWFGLICALGVAIFVVGGMSWIVSLAVVAAACGNLTTRSKLAGAGVAACCLLGFTFGIWHAYGDGNLFTAVIVPALAGLLAYTGAKRSELLVRLHQTRAELARLAVADERLRIARDLHDLLGHSLSLITLKAELAGRLLDSDPGRAASEIAGLEGVARKSLADVRSAVSSYRQPVLAAELAAARQMLAAAGITCRVEVPASCELPATAEAALAWAVREGATNVVRHSGARTATITVVAAGGDASVEIADDGAGPRGGGQPGTGQGSGLAGIAERTAQAGGQVSAGAGHGGKGFRLRVRVPVTAGAGA